MMVKLWMIGLLVLTTTVQECAKKSTGPEDGVPTELVGTWYATAFTYSNAANPSETINMVQSGASFSLAIAEDGAFTATMMMPGSELEITTGTATVDGNQLTAVENNESTVFTWLVIGDVLTMTSQNEEFDFDDDGVDEPAVMTIILTRIQPGSTGNVPSEAVGVWVAISYTYVDDANSSQTFDAVGTGGIGFSLSIQSNGTFVSTWIDSGSSTPDIDTGTIVFNGNQATATSPNGTTLLTWMVSGNTMTLMFSEPYDFNGDGVDEATTVTCIMAKG